VKTIPSPLGQKTSWFASCRESCRKDVERAFGVLQACFAIVWYPALTWSTNQMSDVMIVCVIMHSMILKSGRVAPLIDHGPSCPNFITRCRPSLLLLSLCVWKLKNSIWVATVLEGWLDAAASNTPAVLVLPIAPIRRYCQMAYWRRGWRPCIFLTRLRECCRQQVPTNSIICFLG
jgi:hypothetical protein